MFTNPFCEVFYDTLDKRTILKNFLAWFKYQSHLLTSSLDTQLKYVIVLLPHSFISVSNLELYKHNSSRICHDIHYMHICASEYCMSDVSICDIWVGGY